MNIETARAISDALAHHDAIPGLEVIEHDRPLMPFEAAAFTPTAEQVQAMDETMQEPKQ